MRGVVGFGHFICLLAACLLSLAGCSNSKEPPPTAQLQEPLGQPLLPEAEPNAAAASAMLIVSNSVVRGTLTSSADVDFYAFTAQAGDRLFVATMSAFSGGTFDTILDVIDVDGTTVLESDNDNGSFSATASSIAGRVLPVAGTYYLQVRAPANSAILPYDLHFKLQNGAPQAETEPNDATAEALPTSGWVSGSTTTDADVDLYSIALNAGDTLFASLDLDPERDDTTWNGIIGLLPFVNVLANDNGGEAGADSEALFLTVGTAGTYQIRVSASGTFGTYQLSVSVQPGVAASSQCTTYTSADVPRSIGPDPQQITSTLTVPGNPRIADIDVSLRATHEFPGDWDMRLVSPAGNAVGLVTDVGAPSYRNWDITLDDEAALPAGSFTSLDGYIVQPEAAYRLSWFDGEDAGGVWSLIVNDDAGSDAGTFTGWSIRICEPEAFGCPGTMVPVLQTNFESGAAGFTHAGTADEWALGTPNTGAFVRCNSGTQCWKTDLAGTYEASSSQDLTSAPIDLTGQGGRLQLSWAMQFQFETARNDHSYVQVQEVGGANPKRVWEFADGTMPGTFGSGVVQTTAGWGVHTADISEYSGKSVELVFHVDSNASIQWGGLAIDDVNVSACTCGNGVIDSGEQCDDGANAAGDCCSATCQFESAGSSCADADLCNGSEACNATGTCTAGTAPTVDDGNVCTTDACTASGGVTHTPVATGTACADGDLCNGNETCDVSGTCVAGTAPTVDDGNVCTTDACTASGGVTHTPVATGTACADGDLCNGNETCDVSGTCVAGTAPTVDDGNVCTTDACTASGGVTHTPVATGTACADSDLCNGNETCNAGGTCVAGTAPTVDDGNVCTTDACTASGGVTHTPVATGTACADGDLCNGNETCNAGGTCVAGTAPTVDDGNVCTTDACTASGGVTHTPVATGTACADGDLCNGNETCDVSGTCVAGTAPTVDDGNVCTTDACTASGGVTHTPVATGTACADGDLCNGNETCNAGGTCVAGTAPTVDDGNVCTTDACTASGGVTHTPVATGTACADGDLCNGNETCNSIGSCTAGTAPTLDDANPCTTDACTASVGVTHTPVATGTACADGDLCNGNETCDVSGTCVAGTAPTVDDGNVCTTDACTASGGVTHTPVATGTACADGDICNGNETCNASGTCVAGTAPTVNDNNPCTADACTASGGVTHTPVAQGTACADGNLCNGNETCNASGTCVAGTAPTVNDNNPCTADACTASGGVTHTPVAQGTACADGDLCNGNETCNASGTCVVGTAPAVNDNNPCTADACTANGGVTHTPVAVGTACADGNLCNGNETCNASGTCIAGTAPPVNDNNPCTADACTASGGVTHTPVTQGTACADADLCNGNETCNASGTCIAGPVPIVDDGNPCTADACSAIGGVTHTPLALGTACADSDLCNGDETCNAEGACLPGTPPILDDENPCTDDACDAVTGVAHTPVTLGTACADADLCNGDETCDATGTCVAGIPLLVDDGNACTADSCDALLGVVNLPLEAGSACADADLCNGDEICDASGTCLAGTPPLLDDENECTADVCDPLSGVSHTPVAVGSACDDGDSCHQGEACDESGLCSGGSAVVCTATDTCHLPGTCNPETGVCSEFLAENGTPCPDGSCVDGVCELDANGGAGGEGGTAGAGGDAAGGKGGENTSGEGGEPAMGSGGSLPMSGSGGSGATNSGGNAGEAGDATSGAGNGGEAGESEAPRGGRAGDAGRGGGGGVAVAGNGGRGGSGGRAGAGAGGSASGPSKPRRPRDGCACTVPGDDQRGELGWLVVGVFGAVVLRRRQRSRAAA